MGTSKEIENACRRIILFGNFGTLNLGNEATLQSIVQNLLKLDKGIQIRCVCSEPADVRSRHGIPADPIFRASRRTGSGVAAKRSPLLRLMRAVFIHIPQEIHDWFRAAAVLRGNDLLVMAGTGMLTDITESTFGFQYEIFKWSVCARLSRVELVFMCVGVEPISRRISRFFIGSSLRLSTYISYRDKQSSQYMTNLGISEKFSIYPDIAFSMPQIVLTEPTLLAKPRKVNNRSSVVGIGLYNYLNRGIGCSHDLQRYTGYLHKLAAFVGWLLSRNYTIRILIGDITYDTPVRKDFRSVLKEKGYDYQKYVVIDETVNTVSDLLQQIAKTEVVVATRFHNVLFALLLELPVISISYNSKNNELMRAVNMEKYCRDIDNWEVDWLTKTFEELQINRDSLLQLVREKCTHYRKLLDDQYRRLLFRDNAARGRGS